MEPNRCWTIDSSRMDCFSYDGEVFENIELREGEHDQIHMVDGRTLYIYSRQKNTGLLHNVVYIDFKKYV